MGRTVGEFQDAVGRWADGRFLHQGWSVRDTAQAKLAHLTEEVDELRQAVASGDGLAIPEEAADCFILLLGLAHTYGFDLFEAAEEKHERNLQRIWSEPDAHGVSHHVKGGAA